MADVRIDTTARIERVRYDTQTGSFAGDPAGGYAWHWINTTGTYSGVFTENDQGDIFGPFVDYDEGARVFNSGTISIDDATLTALTFDSERYDTNEIHSIAANTGRLTCQTAGKYIIAALIAFDSNATNSRLIGIRLNGATLIGLVEVEANINTKNTRLNISLLYNLFVGDYVEVIVEQSSGGALDVKAALNHTPEFMMSRIGY